MTFERADDNHVGESVLDANDSFVMMAEYSNGALEVIHTPTVSTFRGLTGENIAAPVWRGIEVSPVESNYQRFSSASSGRCRF